ncbi:MAG: serine/threonine protein kinase [Mariniblastus sp.]
MNGEFDLKRAGCTSLLVGSTTLPVGFYSPFGLYSDCLRTRVQARLLSQVLRLADPFFRLNSPRKNRVSMQGQLEIKRSGHREVFRWPAWINVIGIGGVIAMITVLSVRTVYQSESTLRANVASKLRKILTIECEAVREWVESERQLTTFLASDVELAELLLAADLDSTTGHAALDQYLNEVSKKLDHKPCLLMTAEGEVVADAGDKWLAKQVDTQGVQLREVLLTGKPTNSPVLSPVEGVASVNPYALIVAAPIQHPTQGTIGFFLIGHNAQSELTQVLASSRAGDTGETIAVMGSGELVSQSRFENGANRLNFFSELHSDAIKTGKPQTDGDLSGKLDQRGFATVCVSRWMPEIGIGLMTKKDRSEANAPVIQIRGFMWMLSGLLFLTTISTAFFRWHIYRLRKLAKQADLSRKRLGPYELEEKVGEGGMGVVYRAKHALLRRPTAIKILPPEKSSQASIERFEREVQYTSQLKHPNTISIYDYGRTENGLFYYAMELLEGLNLEQLVRHEGALPDGRVISILRQVCESLREAHALGLVHRDIKPANIMLCDRGGAVDTVKVLDFGMVRDCSLGSNDLIGTLSGTPSYMAPECFTNPAGVDARVDAFAVGAVGFLLLTGTPLFSAKSLAELMGEHQSDLRVSALSRMHAFNEESKRPISNRLAQLISRCVATEREDRFSSVSDVSEELSKCRPCFPWEGNNARDWWQDLTSHKEKPDLQTRIDLASASSLFLDTTQAFTLPTVAETSPRKPLIH